MTNFICMKPRRSTVIFSVFLLILILAVKWYTSNSERVETYYSTGFYQSFSQIPRLLFGWIPFSLGDLLYAAAGLWIIYKLVRIILVVKREKRGMIWQKIKYNSWNLLIAVSILYLFFQLSWGLNYSRQGIGQQLELPRNVYDSSSLAHINELLAEKVNITKAAIAGQQYPSTKALFERANAAYDIAGQHYPFLKYKLSSVKSSLWGWVGNYANFTGYYNPFTGEAQVNTTVPKFLQGFTTLHEIAHQLGYAKEKEASFVGYLAARQSNDSLLLYSTYLDLFVYANRNLYWVDSTAAIQFRNRLSKPVLADIRTWQEFNRKHQGFFEPFIAWAYGKYLQQNGQPQGMLSYDQVLQLLIAYEKKFRDI